MIIILATPNLFKWSLISEADDISCVLLHKNGCRAAPYNLLE